MPETATPARQQWLSPHQSISPGSQLATLQTRHTSKRVAKPSNTVACATNFCRVPHRHTTAMIHAPQRPSACAARARTISCEKRIVRQLGYYMRSVTRTQDLLLESCML